MKSEADNPDLKKLTEKKKKGFAGNEIRGKKLGVIGLGAIGVRVANASLLLGMDVYGYDPYVSVNAAWNLRRDVKHISDINEIFRECDYITIHVPAMDSTKGMISEEAIGMMKKNAVVINCARDVLVDEEAMVKALAEGRIKKYISDFPNPTTAGKEGVVLIPHLGASTAEAEDNCAVMAVQELKDFLENGNIRNSVNYPNCDMGVCDTTARIAILHKNIKGMIGKYTAILGDAGINIENMANKAKGDYAYSILDLGEPMTDEAKKLVEAVDGIIRVNVIK